MRLLTRHGQRTGTNPHRLRWWRQCVFDDSQKQRLPHGRICQSTGTERRRHFRNHHPFRRGCCHARTCRRRTRCDVCTASIAAQDGQQGQAAYAAGKASIIGMTLPIARDLSKFGIRINTILPGIFDTPLMAQASQPTRDAMCATVPFPKRFGEPSEYASLALELCRNCYLNGETIRLDAALRFAAR